MYHPNVAIWYETWGAYTNIDHSKWESTPIEKIHTQLLKRIIGEQILHKHSC